MLSNKTLEALERFLGNVDSWSDFSEVLQVLGYTELEGLVKAARAMEDLKLGKGERGNVDVVICPYCNFADTDWYDYIDAETMEAEFSQDCPRCSKTMYVEMTTDTWFKTSKIKGQEDE